MTSPTALAPEFEVSVRTLGELSPPGDSGAVVLGSGPDRNPVLLTALRERPTNVVVVAGLHLARQIALRAMATGAWIVIGTPRPDPWRPLVDAAGRGPDGRPAPVVSILAQNQMTLPRGSEDTPVLVVYDGGRAPGDPTAPRSPWQCSLTVLPELTRQSAPLVAQADLVLVQRLPLIQAQVAGRIWRLPTRQMEQLVALPEDQAMAFGRDRMQPVHLVTTPTETSILGPIRAGA